METKINAKNKRIIMCVSISVGLSLRFHITCFFVVIPGISPSHFYHLHDLQAQRNHWVVELIDVLAKLSPLSHVWV